MGLTRWFSFGGRMNSRTAIPCDAQQTICSSRAQTGKDCIQDKDINPCTPLRSPYVFLNRTCFALDYFIKIIVWMHVTYKTYSDELIVYVVWAERTYMQNFNCRWVLLTTVFKALLYWHSNSWDRVSQTLLSNFALFSIYIRVSD